MMAQPKREKPEITGTAKPRPEMPSQPKPGPEMTGKGRPGSMPENPASIDHEHEPAGIDPRTDRTKER